jgi:hypothetical protein
MHCWCPPATGPGQPHEPGCVKYKEASEEVSHSHWKEDGSLMPWPNVAHSIESNEQVLTKEAVHKVYAALETDSFFGHGLQYQAALSVSQALQWLAKQNPAPLALATAPMTHSIECTCAAQYGVIGHAAFCPLGEKDEKADNPDEGAYIDLMTT